MKLTSCTVLAFSIPQEVNAVGLGGTLRQNLYRCSLGDRGAASVRSDKNILPSWQIIPVARRTCGVVELAGLPEFASPVLQVILAGRFPRPYWIQRFPWIRRFHPAAAFDIERMVVLAGLAVLAPSRSEIIATVRLAESQWVRSTYLVHTFARRSRRSRRSPYSPGDPQCSCTCQFLRNVSARDDRIVFCRSGSVQKAGTMLPPWLCNNMAHSLLRIVPTEGCHFRFYVGSSGPLLLFARQSGGRRRPRLLVGALSKSKLEGPTVPMSFVA
mmetsp:Transcript_10536/g.22885  ORF Transcript_10536/g.22885 Transcript_10536/m.22885 type:complete len:271 (+) Transcript_10536:766-1578(+)